jgi:hypothetical protein
LSDNEPTADDFLDSPNGLCHDILARDHPAFVRRRCRVSFSFINQSIKPDVELISRALYFIPG